MSPEVWAKYPVAKVSWSLLQDLYHDPRVLEPDPSLTAIACIQLALETFGIQVWMWIYCLDPCSFVSGIVNVELYLTERNIFGSFPLLPKRKFKVSISFLL